MADMDWRKFAGALRLAAMASNPMQRQMPQGLGGYQGLVPGPSSAELGAALVVHDVFNGIADAIEAGIKGE